jgi:hypothetical protein
MGFGSLLWADIGQDRIRSLEAQQPFMLNQRPASPGYDDSLAPRAIFPAHQRHAGARARSASGKRCGCTTSLWPTSHCCVSPLPPTTQRGF